MDIAKLKALAEAATPGPWNMQMEAFDNEGAPESPISALDGRAFVAVTLDFGRNNPLMREANALYIAAANPAAVLELIAKNAELEARIKELEAAQRILIEHNAAKTKLITELEAERNAKQWYPWQDIDVEQQKKEGEAI